MAQPFDITLKHLLEAHPADCLRLVGLTTAAPIEVIDADLATVSAEADKVFRINEPMPWLMHFELQASYDSGLPERMLRYNVLLKTRHGLPVRSVVILLRSKADGPEMTGVVRHALADEQYLEFKYRVFRIWRQPVETVLAAGLWTLPLTPLADVKPRDLPGVIRRMKERVSAVALPSEQAVLWTATYVLMGLRYDEALAHKLLEGVRAMDESVTYQAIIRKGEAKGKAEGEVSEAQRILLRLGTREFGNPDASTKAAIAEILDCERLEALIEHMGHVKGWKHLLGTAKRIPSKPPRRPSPR